MTFAIAQSTSNHDVASSFLPPDVQQLADDIAGLVMSDPGAAAQFLRDLMSSLPDSSNGEIASSVTAGLDDHALQSLSQSPPGRELLDVLGSQPHDQLGRIRDVLFSVAQNSSNWVSQVAQQAIGPAVSMATASAGSTARSQSTNPEQLQSAFKEEFAAKAANKPEFDAFMQQVFGDNYDKGKAEQFRQQALAGDFSFLPQVRYVDAATLHGANGAYSAAEGVVYINKDMAASDPAKAAQTFVEEAGHHLDAQLNTVDAQGDEGEMFRRVLSGENLSAQQIADIRADDDHGTITVDGKQVQVEFWDPFGAIGDAAKAVGGAIADGAKAVGNAVADGAKAVGNAVVDGAKAVGNAVVSGAKAVGGALVDAASWFGDAMATGARFVANAASDIGSGVINAAKKVGKGIYGAIKDVGKGLWEMTGGFLSNLVQGNIGEAFNSVVRGFDHAVFQSVERLSSGVLDGLQ
jgi:hypothetical protein